MNTSIRTLPRRGLGAAALLAILLTSQSVLAAEGYVPFDGAKTTWHGFDRYNYVMDDATGAVKLATQGAKGRQCIVVVPKQPAAGNPWSWRGCYWDHEPQTEVELLRRGFHIAFVAPDPRGQGRAWDTWYKFLTEEHGLSTKPAFIGMSKGGINEYSWAVVNPKACPFLIVNGEEDTTVPLFHAQLMTEALKKANVPVELIIVKNAGHGYTFVAPPGGPPAQPSPAEVDAAVLKFLDANLKK